MVPEKRTGGDGSGAVSVPAVPEPAEKRRGTFLKKLKIVFFPIVMIAALLIGKETILEAPEMPENPVLYREAEYLLESPKNVIIRTKAEKVLDSMTLEEKIGQMFVIPPEALDTEYRGTRYNGKKVKGTVVMSDTLRDRIRYYTPGGFILFSYNIIDPDQTTELLKEMQAESKIPLLIAVDEEGGLVARISGKESFGIPDLPDADEVTDETEAYNRGAYIGAYMMQYGFNCNLAPVADVNSNPSNRVIGSRAFGKDPTIVGGLVASEIDGLKHSGVISTAKHFPGHGDTSGDTHHSTVYVTKNWNELLEAEIVPFRMAMDAEVDMIMVAHISAEKVTTDGYPASLSREMITGKLRNELGFEGVVITDSLEMGAITGQYTSAEAAILAVEAGNDIILMPEDYVEAHNGLLAAVQTGKISEERINESVLRILTMKDRHGLLK
ncbi:MAG: glycoside hydrolase family 3 protein [Eubacterium sp.]|nr:glycoside hydrolase family 3 protein [Eubacterium sp.]